MKKYVKASKHSVKADKKGKQLSDLGQILFNVASPDYYSDEEAAMYTVEELGSMFSYVTNRKEAVHAIVDLINDVASDYLSAQNTHDKMPDVRDYLLDYLRRLGYDAKHHKLNNPPYGADESYVIIPADECTHDDLKTVASAIAKGFGIKPDTGVIGGSWTSYQFKLDGVPFRIGFEEDKDFDPSGRESSLQLYF